MAKVSKIEWADSTWNPWYGCTKISEGCKHCYMDRWAKRTGRDPTVITRSKTTFDDPLKWKDPRMIFVCSLSDFFHEDVPEYWREQAWVIMARANHHTYLLLTKRPENIPSMLPWWWEDCQGNIASNVWLGITAENQETYEKRLPYLLKVPATLRFISAEPLIGSLKLGLDGIVPKEWGHGYTPIGNLINWVIVGGESDFRNPREMKMSWVTRLQNDCSFYGIPFHFKQWGGKSRDSNGVFGGRNLNGHTYDERPQ